MTQPLISIIIPTYNRAELVQRAIASAKQQTYSPVEIIVVDDGSTDNTANVLKTITDIHYLYKPNGGQASARNMGLSIAKGEFIASLDADDVWDPGFLETLYQLVAAESLDFAFANWIQVDREEGSYPFLNNYPELMGFFDKNAKQQLLGVAELREIFARGCPSPSSSFLIKRNSMYEGWKEHLIIADDWCLLLDMIVFKEAKAAFVLEPLWSKYVDGLNICDSRAYKDILRILYFEDTLFLVKRFKGALGQTELDHMNDRFAKAYLQLLDIYRKHRNYKQLASLISVWVANIRVTFWPTLKMVKRVLMKQK